MPPELRMHNLSYPEGRANSVTGCSRGIGQMFVERFLRQSAAKVSTSARISKACNRTAADPRRSGRVSHCRPIAVRVMTLTGLLPRVRG